MSVLELEEITLLRDIEPPKDPQNVVEFEDFTGFWTSTQALIKFGKISQSTKSANFEQAISLNLNIKEGQFCAIVGKIRSGKSSLLMSFTGEMPKTTGNLRFRGRMALVEQEPQIFSGTLRDNIIFGTVFKKDLYIQVIDACCLIDDLKQMPKKDLTDIGERGINLSGGQKARIALARALYSQADIYLLDDPLSGLDFKVAKRVFRKAFMGMLKDKTVLLVTHQVHIIKEAENIIVLDNGEVAGQGSFLELQESGVDISSLMDVKKKVLREGGETYEMNFSASAKDVENERYGQSEKELLDESFELEQQNKQIDPADKVHGFIQTNNQQFGQGEFFIGEDQVQGVKKAAYGYYIKSVFRPFSLIIALIFFGATETANLLYSRTLGKWSDNDYTDDTAIRFLFSIMGSNLLFNLCKNFLFTQTTLTGAKKIHDKMIESVSHFPTKFFVKNPVGRILNRFSNDIGILDSVLPSSIQEGMEGLSYFTVVIASIWIFNPLLFIPAAISFIVYIFIYKSCKRTILETRSLELSTRSPMYSLFSMTLEGAITIRAYRHSDDFIKKFYTMMNQHSRAQLQFASSLRLMSFLINYVTELAVMISLLIVISRKNSTSVAGLLAIQLANLTTYMQFILQNFVMITILMASTERCMKYIRAEQEQSLHMPGDDKLRLKNWPVEGKIEFKNVSMRYNNSNSNNNGERAASGGGGSNNNNNNNGNGNGTKIDVNETHTHINGSNISLNNNNNNTQDKQYTVKNLSMTINPGDKIGIVGRTGSGSSSLINILMRMAEMENKVDSQITIDGIDIKNIGLYLLRHNVSIIPQTPVIFSGSIRNNLDPERMLADKELYHVLEDVGLKQYLRISNLDIDLGKHGMNFSMGQKQLFCLARAILSKSKVLLLDEATAHVDMETDELIQNKILDYFGDSTIFTIAHRLTTIANYDKIAYLDKGSIVEFDEPFLLLVNDIKDKEITKKDGRFARLVFESGARTAEQIFKVARRKYYHAHDLPFEFGDEQDKETTMKGVMDGMFRFLKQAENDDFLNQKQEETKQFEVDLAETAIEENEEEKQAEIAKFLNLDFLIKGLQKNGGQQAIMGYLGSKITSRLENDNSEVQEYPLIPDIKNESQQY